MDRYTQPYVEWECAMIERRSLGDTMRCIMLGCMLIALCSSCQTASVGNLSIVLDENRTIQPSEQDIAITHLLVRGRQTGGGNASFAPQIHRMSDTIRIDGLLAGTWEITISGLCSDRADAVVTREASQSLAIVSGSTSRAVFSLPYLTDGLGTCALSFSWNEQAHSIIGISTMLHQAGEELHTFDNEGPFPLQEGRFSGSCPSHTLVDVGTYDMDVRLSNRSGTHISFPYIDNVRIFHQRHSAGSIALSIPVVSITRMVQSATFSRGSVVDIEISAFPLTAPVYYTTDGSEPTIASNRYTAPISISDTTTIKAVAAIEGYADSRIVTGVYTASNFSITRPPQIGSMDIVTNDYRTFAVVLIDETGLEENQYSWYVDGVLQAGQTSCSITLHALVPGSTYRIMAKVQKGDQSLNTFTRNEYFTIPMES